MIICTFKVDDKAILYFSFCPNTITFPHQIKSKQYRSINSCELDPNVVLTKEIQKVKLIEPIASKHSAKRKLNKLDYFRGVFISYPSFFYVIPLKPLENHA